MKAIAVLALLALVAMTGVTATAESNEVADVDFDELEAENDAFLQVEDSTEEAEAEEEEAEDESEDEAEAEEEEEEEEEESSEEEGESLAETDSEAIAEFESAIGESAAGKWHVYSNLVTETAHEGIAAAALASLPAASQAVFDLPKLKHGVIWNDMPSGVETDEAAMIKDGHMDVDTWTRIFKLTGGIDDLVFNTHYGCLQHWHSMAPIQRLEAKNPAATRIVFTNAQVKKFILAQLRAWWQSAVGHKADKVKSSWYIGHILHAIQDSYPRGHTVRTSTETTCGDIVSFQGYDAQHGNKAHATADHSPNHKNKEADKTLAKRYSCAKAESAQVLVAFAACAKSNKCDAGALNTILERVYRVSAAAAGKLAGGSAKEFAKKGIETDANYVRETVGSVVLFNPKSTKIWGTAAARGPATLCAGRKPIISKAPTGFGVYREKDFRGFVDPRNA